MSDSRRQCLLAVACALAIVAGCTVGPDFHRPAAPGAELYIAPTPPGPTATSSDQEVALGENLQQDWWKLFQSDDLNEVVRRALAGNRTLSSAAATLAQARELTAAESGRRYPQLGVTAGIGGQKYGAEFLGSLAKPPPFTYYAVGPTISYSFDYLGGVARSVEQRQALAEYQRQQLDAAYLAVTGNAVMESLRIALLREQIATVQEILDEDRQNQQLVRTAYEAGSVARVDTVSAESQLASDATLLPPLKQELSVARHALSIVLGQPPAAALPADIDLSKVALPHHLPVSLPSELVHRRPDILATEAQLHAATAAVGVATANLYPHIDLTASTGLQSTVLGHLFEGTSSVYGIAGSLVAPLFDGGRLRAEKRAAVDAMQASVADYQQTVLVAFGQVADSLQALDHDAEQLDAEAHAESAAHENVELTRRSYNEGNVGVLQVLDAERLYQNARLGYVRAQAQRYLDTVQLFLALGGSGPDAVVSTARAQ
ncbi:MAG TPA: efflux transporter outer membrane subunit [Steroidobacteraceae bacterium]|nr:efflux transporter outer membrane subunit [Steroidobacteraceae bacterium]